MIPVAENSGAPVQVLEPAAASLDPRLDRWQALLEASEARIDRTNAMVGSLVSVVENLTTTYSRHLDALSKCRDELAAQNTDLIKHCNALIERIDRLQAAREKSDAEWRVFLRDAVISGRSENNINVK